MLKILTFALSISTAHALTATVAQKVVLIGALSKGMEGGCGCVITTIKPQWETWPDTSKWVIMWADGTTDAQKTAGLAYLAAFDPTKYLQ